MKKNYEWGGSISFNKMLSSLQNLKKEAASADAILGAIGNRGNLNDLVDQFVKLDGAVEELMADVSSLKSELGGSLKGGYLSSLDGVFKRLAEISKISNNVFSGLSKIDLNDSKAPQQLEQLAKQLNQLMPMLGVDKKINLELFSTKDVKAQFNEVVGLARNLNDQINVAIGDIDLSKVKKQVTEQISLYDQLRQKVQEYKKASDISLDEGASERAVDKAYKSMQKLIDEIAELTKSEGKINRIKSILSQFQSTETISAESVLQDLVKELGVEIPQASEKTESSVEQSFKTITSGADSAKKSVQDLDKTIQQVMYHLGKGSALSGGGAQRDTFADMLDNLTENAKGTQYEKYGYGVLGSGLFGVQNPSTIPTDQAASAGKFIYSVDLSKYNMYMIDTEERAMALMDFMSKLQKYSIKSALPSYTGFDEHLKNADVNSLYEQAKVLFDQTDLTKDKFESFVVEMVEILKRAGLSFDQESGYLNFDNISRDLASSDNISTRFFKMLGYQGVNVGNTSLDGFGQGSVLFDYDPSDVVGYFSSIKEAEQDFHNISKQGWVGSEEQLKTYLTNLDAVIEKVKLARKSLVDRFSSSGRQVPDEMVKPYDNTLALLENTKQNINDILSGKISGEESVFKRITGDVSELDKAEEKLKSFMALANQISENSLIAEKTDVELGKYEQQLESAREELLKFGEQNQLAANQIAEMEEAFKSAMQRISEAKQVHEGDAEDLVGRVDDAEQREAEANNKLEKARESLASELSKLNAAGVEDDSELTNIVNKRKELLELAEKSGVLNEEELAEQKAITAEIEKRIGAQSKQNGEQQEQAAAAEKQASAATEAADANKKLGDEAENTAGDIGKEGNEAKEATEWMEKLAAAKKEAAEANKKLGDEAVETAGDIGKETDAVKKFEDATANTNQSAKSAFNMIKDWFVSKDKFKGRSEDSTNSFVQQHIDNLLAQAFQVNVGKAQASPDANINFRSMDVNEAREQYELFDKVLRQIGFHFGEFEAIDLKDFGIHFHAQVIRNSENFVDNLEEARNILMGIGQQIEQNSKKEQNANDDLEGDNKKKEKQKKSSRAPYKQSAITSAEGRYLNLKRLSQSYVDNGSTVVTEQLNKYRTALDLLSDKQKEINALNDLSSADAQRKKSEFDALSKECNEYAKDLEKVINASKRFASDRQNASSGFYDFNSAEGRQAALANYVKNTYGDNIKSIQGFNEELTELNFTIKGSDGHLQKMTAAFDKTGTVIATTSQKTSKANTVLGSMFGELQKKWRGLLAYATARMGVDDVIRQVRQGIEYIREIDSALTELKKVTEGTDETYARFLDNMSHTASVVGSTVSDLTIMAAEWARLGYSIEDSAKLAESTAILLNVSEFSDATEASEALISTMQAFQYTADESQHVVDILNEVGK